MNEIKADDVWAILENDDFKELAYGTKKHYLRHIRAAIENEGYKPEKVIKGGKEVELKPNFHSLRVGYIMAALSAIIPHLVLMAQAGHRDYAPPEDTSQSFAEQDLEIHDSSIKIEEFIKRTARKKVG